MVGYKDLHKMKGMATNVKCGLVRYGGKRIIGCGKSATGTKPHQGFWYKDKTGVISSVYLCDKCAKKVKK